MFSTSKLSFDFMTYSEKKSNYYGRSDSKVMTFCSAVFFAAFEKFSQPLTSLDNFRAPMPDAKKKGGLY